MTACSQPGLEVVVSVLGLYATDSPALPLRRPLTAVLSSLRVIQSYATMCSEPEILLCPRYSTALAEPSVSPVAGVHALVSAPPRARGSGVLCDMVSALRECSEQWGKQARKRGRQTHARGSPVRMRRTDRHIAITAPTWR